MAENFRTKMPDLQRAKQFIPFQSLKGFEDALKQKEIEIFIKKEPTEEKENYINNQLNTIKKGEKITVTYFCSGEYVSCSGILRKVDYCLKTITVDQTTIKIDDLWDLN
ncbi:MAG: YolD-like family protein [Clostridiales bacterium]|nr:YolD-like family protein [Clostridiales bacterium]